MEKQENWIPIPMFEGRYEVLLTPEGTLVRNAKSKRELTKHTKECIREYVAIDSCWFSMHAILEDILKNSGISNLKFQIPVVLQRGQGKGKERHRFKTITAAANFLANLYKEPIHAMRRLIMCGCARDYRTYFPEYKPDNRKYSGSEWYPIHSFQGRYEINKQLQVRKTSTGDLLRLMKRDNSDYVMLFDKENNTRHRYSVKKLAWEAFGYEYKNGLEKPVDVYKNGKFVKSFKSFMKCAEYLAPKMNYAVGTLRFYLAHRRPELGDYEINYLEC